MGLLEISLLGERTMLQSESKGKSQRTKCLNSVCHCVGFFHLSLLEYQEVPLEWWLLLFIDAGTPLQQKPEPF